MTLDATPTPASSPTSIALAPPFAAPADVGYSSAAVGLIVLSLIAVLVAGAVARVVRRLLDRRAWRQGWREGWRDGRLIDAIAGRIQQIRDDAETRGFARGLARAREIEEEPRGGGGGLRPVR